MIKAILFDMNGVIIDDEHIHEQAWFDVLKNKGLDLSKAEMDMLIMGRTDHEGAKNIAKHFGMEAMPEELVKLKIERSLELEDSGILAPEGLHELLKKTKEKHKIGLVTSALQMEVDKVLEKFEIRKYFDVTISGEDVNNGKPHPEPYLKAAQFLGVSPSECIVIEDSPTGIRSAKLAGMKVYAVETKHMASKDKSEADMIIGSLAQLKQEDFQ